jgi:hypothetical protein
MIRKKTIITLTAVLIIASLSIQPALAYSAGRILKKGMRDPNVTELQNDLKMLGFFSENPTGYYGDITNNAVVEFQKKYGLTPDGIAGKNTIGKISELKNSGDTYLKAETLAAPAEGQTVENEIQKLNWFDDVRYIFAKGDVATVIDVETGLEFQAKRTYGSRHADCETLTANDTEILRQIAGGDWNWTRRPVIVVIDGYRIAGSMTAMPHAGRDDAPANKTVRNRSDGYGTGANLDAVKDNGMDGVFDIHFDGSKTHTTNRVDKAHQNAIAKAFSSGI